MNDNTEDSENTKTLLIKAPEYAVSLTAQLSTE